MFTSKKGRPRKDDVTRYPGGQIKPDANTATAEEARIRQLLGVDVWKKARRNERALSEARKRVSNPLLGSALGRFLYAKEIDQDQHDAGLWFAELYRDFCIIRGLPSPNVRALDYGAIPGRSTAPDMTEGQIKRLRGDWERAMKFVYAAHGDNGLTTGPVFEILKRTIIEDIGPLNAYELGNLRIGLNALNQAKGA